ncbi:MAG: prepilin-type N-terminal cleavage/methylation domain-containing protein [Candidatus Omnitrophica bacterium]|nr:prepilin-type N-terminal cleavage/methylation domain-containing protein [Candidatus Omnitrophota bacterium]
MLRQKLGKGGFTLVEIMIVVAIIGLLAAVAIPNFVKAREKAQTNACIANLKQIDGAKTLWALDDGASSSDTPTWGDLVPDYIKTTPSCPANGTYSLNDVGSDPTCTVTNHELPT